LAVAAIIFVVLGAQFIKQVTRTQVLLTDNGSAFVGLMASASASTTARFSDGSSIEAKPNTAVRGLASTAQEFSVLLERGTIDVKVTPGGPRRWVIEAKRARIEVVGTQFSVSRGARDEVIVAVKVGVVLVRSPWLAEGVERVTAGRTLRLESPEIAPPNPSPSNGNSRVESLERDSSLTDRSTVHAASELPLIASNAVPSTAFAVEPLPVTAATLLREADQLRVSGEAARAERLLERLVQQFRAAPEAAFGAYSLGVVRIKLGKTALAAEAFKVALNLKSSESLKQDCFLRLIETELSLGDRPKALELNDEYRRRFPAGRYRQTLADLLGTNAEAKTP
jgi:transmembrane sensor